MELWLLGVMKGYGVEHDRRDTGLRWRSHGVCCKTKRTVRVRRIRTVRIRSSVRVYDLRGCEDNQYQDDERRCQPAQLRAVILDCVVHSV